MKKLWYLKSMITALYANDGEFNLKSCFLCNGTKVFLSARGSIHAGVLLLQKELGEILYEKLKADLKLTRWPNFGFRYNISLVGCVKVSEILQWLHENVKPDQL